MSRSGLAAALVACALGSGAAGQPAPPLLADVTGLAPGGALRIRAAPSDAAEVLGWLPAGTRGVEVVALDSTGHWGAVNLGEGGGWVGMRFLAPRPNVWAEGAMPERLTCRGTEPFWAVRFSGAAATLSRPDGEAALETRYALAVGAADLARREVIAEGGGVRLIGLISPAACGDGMSDRAYGLVFDAVLEEAGATSVLQGCCSIAP